MSKTTGAKKAAEYSARLYNDYHSARNDWSMQIALDRDYFLGKQWTDDEAAVLKARGQAPLVINLIYPIVQQKLAQLTAHKPVLRAVPVEENDNKKAELWTLMIEYVLQSSNYGLIDLEVKRDHIISGVGYYYVYVDPYADDGKGEVRVASLPPDIVYVDPHSRKPDYSDADHILVSQVYTMQQAKNLFPDKTRLLNKAKDQLVHTQDYFGTSMYSSEGVVTPDMATQLAQETDQGKVRIIDRYSKIQVPFYIVVNEALGFYDVVDQKKYNDGFKGREGYVATRTHRMQVERVTTAGESSLLYREILPIEEYPIIPVPNVWIGTPYPLGDVRPLRSPQDERNKRRSVMILTAMSNTSPKWLYEEGSIDEAVWERRMHTPNAKLPYKALGTGSQPPREIFAQSLPASLVQLEMEAKHDIRDISGVYGVSHGDPQGAPETYGATLALEEYANRRLLPSVEILTHAKALLGKVIIGLCQETYTLPKFIRVVGDEGLAQEVMINKPEKRGERTIYKDALDQQRYDVIIQSGKFAPTNRIAHGQHMLKLYEINILDRQAAIEALDIPNKEKLLERLSEINQLQGLVQGQEKEIKELEGLLQTLRRQLQQAGIKTTVDEHRVMEKSALLDTKSRLGDIERDAELDAGKARVALQALTSQTSGDGDGKTKEKK